MAKKSETKAAGSSPIASIEAPVMGIVEAIPLPYIKKWASMYFHPMETYGSNKKEMSWGSIATHLALAGVVAWVAAFISSILGLGIGLALALIIGVVVYPIAMVIGGFIGSIIYYIVAKVLGGKGGFMEQTYAFAILTGGYMLMMFPFTALGGLPLIGWLFSLVGMLVGLYNLYNYYLIIKGVHEVSSNRAIVILLVPIIIAVVVAFVMAAAMVAVLAPYMAGAVATKGLGY